MRCPAPNTATAKQHSKGNTPSVCQHPQFLLQIKRKSQRQKSTVTSPKKAKSEKPKGKTDNETRQGERKAVERQRSKQNRHQQNSRIVFVPIIHQKSHRATHHPGFPSSIPKISNNSRQLLQASQPNQPPLPIQPPTKPDQNQTRPEPDQTRPDSL